MIKIACILALLAAPGAASREESKLRRLADKPPKKDDKKDDKKEDDKKTSAPTVAPTNGCTTAFLYEGDIDGAYTTFRCPDVVIGSFAENAVCENILTVVGSSDPVFMTNSGTNAIGYNKYYSKAGFTDYLSFYSSGNAQLDIVAPFAGYATVDYGAVCSTTTLKKEGVEQDSVTAAGCQPDGFATPATKIKNIGNVASGNVISIIEDGVSMIKSVTFCPGTAPVDPAPTCRVLRITPGGDYLNLYEVKAYDASGNVVAPTAAQMTPVPLDQSGQVFAASRCINGVPTTTGVVLNDLAETCHSGPATPNDPDRGMIITYMDASVITHVEIFNRWDSGNDANTGMINGGAVQLFTDASLQTPCSGQVTVNGFNSDGSYPQNINFGITYTQPP